MSDFDDEDDDNFFAGNDETPQADRPLGLVVGPKARVIYDAKGQVLYDELGQMERAYRFKGGAVIVFEEEGESAAGFGQ